MLHMLRKCDEEKLMKLFFRKPTYEFHLRELSKELKWGPGKVERIIKKIDKSLIVETRKKNLRIFKADYNSENFRECKLLWNIKTTKGFIKKMPYFECVVIFGSASKGEDIERSDVDLCVIGKEKHFSVRELEEKTNRKVNILFIDNALKLRKNKELLNNLINGIIVKGYFKVF